jgi:hypothetical protein
MEEQTMSETEKTERREIYGSLSEQFPKEMERNLNKGGTNLTYIPVSEVINRMNKVLGVENWSFSIKGYTEIGDSIVAHVTVIATIDGKEVSRDGVGGQKIKRIKATGLAVDYGDEVKGAVSDALKKAVQTLGVGLYLARSDDAMEIEQAMDAPVDESVQTWESFVSVSKGLNESKRSQLNDFWASISSNAPKPKRSSDVPLGQLQELLTEATRLSFEK